MGLTKQYLRYLPSAHFGIIGSTRCNIEFLSLRNSTARFVASGSCEHVIIWDTKTMQKVMVLLGDKHEATKLVKSPDKQHLSVGYADGSIRIFSLLTSEMIVTYSGHRSAISCLAYDNEGMRLASGSHDTEIVIWDLVNESGLYRLKGHKGPVTACHFVKKKKFLVSSSKDTFIKWWDLDTQHCFKTMMGHRAEIWVFIITPDESMLITGSSDSELRVWELEFGNTAKRTFEVRDETDEEDNTEDSSQVSCMKLGSIMRKETDRVVSICMSDDGHYFACHGNNKNVEVFKIRSKDEVDTHLKKKAKKIRKQQSLQQAGGNLDIIQEEPLIQISADDRITQIGKFRNTAKTRFVDVSKVGNKDVYSFMSLLANNQMAVHNADLNQNKPEFSAVSKLCMDGHRGDCRSLSFTSDGLALCSVSSNCAKLWNRTSQQCVRTSSCDNATACAIVPGDKQIVVGTMSGNLEIHDIPSGKCVETVECHSESITGLSIYPDKCGLATGSKDKSVKFWDFDLVLDEKFSMTSKRLTLTHSRTLQLDDEVTAFEFSQNRKLISCAFLDCSVKIFFVDTLKFFLSLYGHSLPVTCMSITHDSTLIATGSSDRNIKLWGLDFGDCHKSIFAHDDSVTCVRFIPDTHLLFSCGRDGLIKQWDADKFVHIQTLQGHHGAVWCIVIDLEGDYVASCGADKSIRLWSRSAEVVIPDEEREQEREEEDEKRLVKNFAVTAAGETEPEESGMASQATIKTIKGAELIMEAVQLYRDEGGETLDEGVKKIRTNSKPHPILQAYGNISASRYVLEMIRKVKSSELEESLLVLPFSYIPDLLKLLNKFVALGWEVELACRCLFFLLKIHQKVITSNQMLTSILADLQHNTEAKVQDLQDTIGFNKAALEHLKTQIEAKNEITFFADATQRFRQKSRKRKKAQQLAILTI